MGLAASQGRFLMLTSRKNDLEFQGQQVNQARTSLGNETAGLFQQLVDLPVPSAPNPGASSFEFSYTIAGQTFSYTGTDYNAALTVYNQARVAYDRQYAVINEKTVEIQKKDRNLELLLKNIDSQHQAVQTEIEAVKKVIDKNIEMTFKTFA